MCCGVARKYKSAEITGNNSQNMTRFWRDMVYHRTKKHTKTVIFPDACFFSFPRFAYVCRQKIQIQTPKNALFCRRSNSKGPNHTLAKVLINETPNIEDSSGTLGFHGILKKQMHLQILFVLISKTSGPLCETRLCLDTIPLPVSVSNCHVWFNPSC